MFSVNLKIISELKSFIELTISNKDLLNLFSTSEKAFTRSRKLPFEKTVVLIAKLCKKTLSFEIDSFFEDFRTGVSCSVSAFCQQRLKVCPRYFVYWNKVLINSFYHYNSSSIKRWKGYRIIAADGSNISLINNKSFREYFGGQRNQTSFFVQAKTFYHYDVLNELILLGEIKPYCHGEIKMAYQAINYLEKDMLTIYDRNFSNYKMIALHVWQEQERKFIIRANERHKWIKEFILTGQLDSMVTIYPSLAMIEGLKSSGFIVNKETPIQVRLIRVDLGNSVEVLITNIKITEVETIEEFKNLYHLRWGVETNIAVQKNILQLESFSGLSVEAVLQDFHATVMIANLHSVIIKDAQKTVEKKMTHRKYPVKINKNKSFGKLKINIVKIFTSNSPDLILKYLYKCFIKEVIPIRRGRSFNRIKINIQSKSKFKTFTNFKPAY